MGISLRNFENLKTTPGISTRLKRNLMLLLFPIEGMVLLKDQKYIQGNGTYGQILTVVDVLDAYVYGCTDPEALNFNEYANMDDGSCDYTIEQSIDLLSYQLNNISFNVNLWNSYDFEEQRDKVERLVFEGGKLKFVSVEEVGRGGEDVLEDDFAASLLRKPGDNPDDPPEPKPSSKKSSKKK